MTDIRGAGPASKADLTERLRDAASRRGYYDSNGYWVNDGQLLAEAADEIERVRGQLNEWRRSLEPWSPAPTSSAQEER